MNRILLFCALGLMLGCRPAAEPSGEVITLSYVTSEQSKTDALTAGDEVAVFARIEGTESYFLEGVKFVTGSDGRTLSTSPASYYPEVKQAVEFFAYFPYHKGLFSVPSDQSTATALKQADLCWATAQSTPVTVVPLEFRHLFSRLVITTNEPTAKIACNVVPSGVLNAATAEFVLKSNKEEVSTTGNELILPAQPLPRLIITVSGVEYSFESSISLEAGKTTSLNLTLNSSTQTATLNGSSTTDWTASATQGTPTEAVSNILTLHWANYVPQGATPDKIIMTIGGTDYTVSSGITYANKTFTVPFASDKLRYPYTISKITFSGIPLACNQLLGEVVYKSGPSTVGIKDIPNAVLINGVWWATGNLVADGPNGCKIGAPTDCGLYFQFGSLIGWSGGATPNYDGTGFGTNHTPQIKVIPVVLHSSYNPGAIWPTGGNTTGLTKPYFSVTTALYATPGTDIRDYTGAPISGSGVDLSKTDLATGRYAPMGVGDPCTYYLGPVWRTPGPTEHKALTGLTIPHTWGTPSVGTWTMSNIYWQCIINGVVLQGPATCSLRSASGVYMPIHSTDGAWGYSVVWGAGLRAIALINPSGMRIWSGVAPGYDESNAGNGLPARCVAE